MVDGSTITCEGIKDATCIKVTFKLGASNQERDAKDVERVLPSGDQSLDTALRLLKDGGATDRIESNLKRALDRGDAAIKPYAQYFLGECLERQNKVAEAIAEYEKVAALKADHFYAPVGLYRAAQLLIAQNKAADAERRLARLASGDFGPAWKDKGAYMQARLQLKAGQKDQAKGSFGKLASSASTPAVRHLASCGEATCELLANQLEPAKRKFQLVVSARDATGEAKGWAFKGLGDCFKASSPDEALLSYLRSFLLYPSNPEAGAAAAGAGEVANAQKLEGAQRLTALARGQFGWGDYSGPQPDAELMRRTMQQVSAALVRRLAPGLAAKATGAEKAELEFLAADALKIIGTQTKNADVLKEYEETLKALQAKYPNHGRAQLAGIDGFIASKDRALTLIAQANEETDTARKNDLMAQGRKLFADNMEPFKRTIAELTKQVDAWTEKEAATELGQLQGAEAEQKQEAEFRRDLAEFLLAEAYASYATTFAEGDKGREDNLKKALEGYEHQINNRGQFQRLLNYAYVGRVDIQIELGGPLLEEAIRNARELTDVEPPFIPDDPQAKREILDGAKEMCIRAHIALIRALLKAGKGSEAVEAAQGIESKKYARGWQDHPMGVLFSFERAKAYGGAGQGARGAQELWAVVQKAMQAPEAERIPGLGMSKIGAGACRALSELSDVSGGEIYPAPMQYHVGIGYFLRSRPELAIAAFKGVLVAARTPAERREWVPKAVRQIGNLLFEQQRFLEAALAYETVMTEFPDHDDAGDAIKYSLSAAKRAITQFREDATNTSTPVVKLYKRIEGSAAQSSGAVAMTMFMREAADLHTKGQWLDAAEKYMAVPAEVEEDGKKKKVDIYPNAIANAGYCLFQAYKQKKEQPLLTRAREQLTRAVQLARAASDIEAQSLAAFYLGELECDLERPTEALAALAPFDAELRGATRYMVRARYQQAQAHLMIKPSPPDALEKAEECYRKVADKRGDDKLANFAYFMARTIKSRAIGLLKEAPDQLDQARALRRKAGQYARDFFETTEKDAMREAHYFWVGGVVFDGGLYGDAVTIYREALGKFKRPAPDGSEGATRAQGDFDTAELNLAFAMVMSGQHREGYDALSRARSTVDIKDARDGRLLGRARFKGREQLGPFNMKFQGVVRPQKIWFTVLELDGKETKFFDTANPAAGDSEFTGVEGTDPTASWNPTAQRKLTLPLKRDYLVVDGMCRAAWVLYQQNKDKNWLANELSAAINELRYVLRGMSDSYYRALMGSSQLEPTDYVLRVWDADVQYLRLKMAREQWREVASDIKQMEMLGKLKDCPPAILEQINTLKSEAEAKQ